jgi:hypothetical protein
MDHIANSVPDRLSRTAYKGASTKKGRRAPGSTIVPGAIQAPRKGVKRDRMRATETGTALTSWRNASKNVRGL